MIKAPNKKAQTAIEFVSTYGWAVLLIAIVLGAMYALGFFNGNTFFSPRAAPGSCSVDRPAGPGTTSYINTEGVCGGELPLYVSHYGYIGHFSNFGVSNLTVLSVKFQPEVTNYNGKRITITGWVFSSPQGDTQTAFAYGSFATGPPYNGTYLNTNESGFCNSGMFAIIYNTNLCLYQTKIPINQWMFVTIEYNGSQMVAYLITEGGNVIKANSVTGNFLIPAHATLFISTPWNGLMSNIQMYNTSLSYNQVYSDYKSGIGGAPVNLQNLVGWWPLNGNSNDYSGNGNNANALNSSAFSGSGVWSNSYLQP